MYMFLYTLQSASTVVDIMVLILTVLTFYLYLYMYWKSFSIYCKYIHNVLVSMPHFNQFFFDDVVIIVNYHFLIHVYKTEKSRLDVIVPSATAYYEYFIL